MVLEITSVDDDQAESIEVGGVGFGTRLTFQGFKLVASGFFNHGLGMQFQGNIRWCLFWIS